MQEKAFESEPTMSTSSERPQAHHRRTATTGTDHARAVGIVDVQDAAVRAGHHGPARPRAESCRHAVDPVDGDHRRRMRLGLQQLPERVADGRDATPAAWPRWRRRSWPPAGCCRATGRSTTSRSSGRVTAGIKSDVGQRDARVNQRVLDAQPLGPAAVRPLRTARTLEKAREAPLWVPQGISRHRTWPARRPGAGPGPRKLSEPKL